MRKLATIDVFNEGKWVDATNNVYDYQDAIEVRDSLKRHFPRMTFRINYGDNLDAAATMFGKLLK